MRGQARLCTSAIAFAEVAARTLATARSHRWPCRRNCFAHIRGAAVRRICAATEYATFAVQARQIRSIDRRARAGAGPDAGHEQRARFRRHSRAYGSRTGRNDLRRTVLTLYPEMFPGPLGTSLAGRALARASGRSRPCISATSPTDRHRTVDDTPGGRRGGDGAARRRGREGARQRGAGAARAGAHAAGQAADAGPRARTGGGAGRRPAVRAVRGVRRAPVRRARRSRKCRSATMSCRAGRWGRWWCSTLAFGCFPA